MDKARGKMKKHFVGYFLFQSASNIMTDVGEECSEEAPKAISNRSPNLDEKYSEEAPEAFPEGPPNPFAQHLPRLS